jgi:hypothetical protein
MTGQDEIIELRRNGLAPVVTWQDGDDTGFWKRINSDARKNSDESPTRMVITKTTELPSSFDLRFLVNLNVLVFTQGDEARANKLRDAVMGAKALRVTVTGAPRIEYGYEVFGYLTHQTKGMEAVWHRF